MSPPARLVLVRHGESTWNAEGRLQGQADPPLSDAGREQALTLLAWVRAQAPDRVVTSDLARARETAALLGWPEATPDPRWREVDIGDWTGRLVGEVLEEDGEGFRAWRAGRHAAPGGEGYEAMQARVAQAGRELLDGDAQTTLVVCHGGPIRMLCVALLGLELRRLGGVGNGSATVLEGHDGGARLVAYNLSGAGGEVL